MTETAVKTLKTIQASTVQAQRVEWAIRDLVPAGTLTVVAGPSGIGKTTVVLSMLAAFTTGKNPGEWEGEPRNVLILSPEDDMARITRPRLEAAGADLEKVHFIAATRETRSGEIETNVSFPSDIDQLHKLVQDTRPVAILLDPIASVIDGNLDKREDVRAAFDALAAEIANTYRLAVILIAHNKKGMDNVRGKISGSAAITDAARSVIAMARDDETEQVVLSIDKSSYSTAEGTNLAYALVSVDVPIGNTGMCTTVAQAVYVGEAGTSVADLNARQNPPGGQDAEDDRSEAERWLLSELETAGGAAPAADVRKAANRDGLSWDAVKRASRSMVDKSKSGFQGAWVWTLDLTKGSTKGAKGAGEEPRAPFAPFDETALPLTASEDVKGVTGHSTDTFDTFDSRSDTFTNVTPMFEGATS